MRLIGFLAIALLLAGPPRPAIAWEGLEAAARLMPQPDGRRVIFEYADLDALRRDGDLPGLLAVGGEGEPWGPIVRIPGALAQSLGVAPERIRRMLAMDAATRPFVGLWGDRGFAAAAGERLLARDFAVTDQDGSRLYSRWEDDHGDITTRERSDPFSMNGQAQRILAFDDTLAGAVDAAELLAMDARRRRGDASVMGQALLATIAPMRAALPRGIAIMQAAAFWVEAFDHGESHRRELDPARPERPLPPDIWPDDPRLPAFAFALFAAAELNGSPVLMVAVVYADPRQAEFAAPLIADAVRTHGAGQGEPISRVHDWVLTGRGLHVAMATVLFGTAQRARASTALRAWLDQLHAGEFVPLDLRY